MQAAIMDQDFWDLRIIMILLRKKNIFLSGEGSAKPVQTPLSPRRGKGRTPPNPRQGELLKDFTNTISPCGGSGGEEYLLKESNHVLSIKKFDHRPGSPHGGR
jgi:hypothetical protein